MTLRSRTALALAGVSAVGFLDASYLAFKFFRGGAFTCTILTDCDTVTTSAYSTIGGVPVALLGAVYYLGMLLASVWVLDRKRDTDLTWVARASVLGLVASVYFVSVQAFVLRAWCQYCVVSALTSTTLFIVGAVWLFHQRKRS